MYPAVFISGKVIIEVCGTIGVSTPVSLVEERIVTDTIMDTLISLAEDESLTLSRVRLNPSNHSVATVSRISDL